MTRWRSAALLLAVALLLPGARRVRLIDPIPWVEVTAYESDDLRDIVQARAKVVAGDPVPFDGWVLSGQDFARLVAAYEDLAAQLSATEEARRRDRYLADEIHASTVDGLKTCRANRPKDFVAGAGVGFAGCAAVGWAVSEGRAVRLLQ